MMWLVVIIWGVVDVDVDDGDCDGAAVVVADDNAADAPRSKWWPCGPLNAAVPRRR